MDRGAFPITTKENEIKGRETVLKVNDDYHMRYSPSDSEIYYTSSEDPTIFAKGTPCTFCEDEPLEVDSVTVLHEEGTFYMIAYGSTNEVFNIYISNNRTAWEHKGLVLDSS